MLMPCPTHVNCPTTDFLGEDTPFANLSSERQDNLFFVGINFGDGQNPPKLGCGSVNNSAMAICSGATAEAAALCAANQQVINSVAGQSCPGPIYPTPPPITGWPPAPIPTAPITPGGPPPTVFYNQIIQAVYTCPDKLFFNWQVAAGTYAGRDQATCDNQASQTASQKANANHICLSDLPTSPVPSGTEYGHVIYASGNNKPYYLDVTSGSVPPGILLYGYPPNGLLLNGTPTTAGTYNFAVTAQDKLGNFMTKNYTIVVTGNSCESVFAAPVWFAVPDSGGPIPPTTNGGSGLGRNFSAFSTQPGGGMSNGLTIAFGGSYGPDVPYNLGVPMTCKLTVTIVTSGYFTNTFAVVARTPGGNVSLVSKISYPAGTYVWPFTIPATATAVFFWSTVTGGNNVTPGSITVNGSFGT